MFYGRKSFLCFGSGRCITMDCRRAITLDFLNFQCGYISNKLRRIYDFSIRSVKSVNLGHISLADCRMLLPYYLFKFYPQTSSANFQAGLSGMAA